VTYPKQMWQGSGPRSSTHLCGFRTILAETWATRRYQLETLKVEYMKEVAEEYKLWK